MKVILYKKDSPCYSIIKKYYKLYESFFNKTNKIKLINLFFYSCYLSVKSIPNTNLCLYDRNIIVKLLFINKVYIELHNEDIPTIEQEDELDADRMMYLSVMVDFNRTNEIEILRVLEREKQKLKGGDTIKTIILEVLYLRKTKRRRRRRLVVE